MKTIGVNRISLVLVSLFCCHGLTDGFVLKGEQIEKNSNFVVVAVESKLLPMDYILSFFDQSIKMLDIPNKLLDHKFIINKSAVTSPLILYETSTQIPDPNASKRIIRQANTADGLLRKANLTKSPHGVYYNTMNSTAAEHSTRMIDTMLNGVSNCTSYISTIKKYSTRMIDTMLNGVYNYTSYISTIKNQSMKMIDNMFIGVSKWVSYMKNKEYDLISTISVCALIGAFFGILLFVAGKAIQLRKARNGVKEHMPENILMYMV
ncbi:uncharacterized protein LOC100575648 [Acyrthosiphon pisum]|uniref:Uncharacterized protein n=1 Tax=Acyrthosiphon pisum TaxID=7029 RepID=A0A8R1W6I0_ACYPI|nr:uncharacterized protein LOC100575648 [Acyrthosiphon pisum]|eukprot:XP_003240320.1 PREDICTED: uncharacterized protein LOC100575648 isoform X1 [Acyrthosiphon pisum]